MREGGDEGGGLGRTVPDGVRDPDGLAEADGFPVLRDAVAVPDAELEVKDGVFAGVERDDAFFRVLDCGRKGLDMPGTA